MSLPNQLNTSCNYHQLLLSVVLPVFDVPQEWFIKAVDSILDQTFSNFELIIVLDNPHAPFLESLISAYQEKDNRVVFVKNLSNLGLAKSLNKAINLANGKYIARMDADDISDLKRFEKQIKFLDNNPSVSLCGGQAIKINAKGREICPTQNALEYDLIKKLIPFENPTTHPTWMFRKKDIVEIGLYRHFPHAIDYDLITRLITNGKRVCNLSDVVLKYRMHFDSLSGKTSLEQKVFFRYVQELYLFRLKNGYDTFRAKDINLYLDENYPFLNSGENKLWKARMESVLVKLFLVVKIFVSSKIERQYLVNLLKARFIKIKFNCFSRINTAS